MNVKTISDISSIGDLFIECTIITTAIQNYYLTLLLLPFKNKKTQQAQNKVSLHLQYTEFIQSNITASYKMLQ